MRGPRKKENLRPRGKGRYFTPRNPDPKSGGFFLERPELGARGMRKSEKRTENRGEGLKQTLHRFCTGGVSYPLLILS